VRDLLSRFRPAGAPGPATVPGVPADRRESAAAELEPAFSALDGVLKECRQTRRDAMEFAATLAGRTAEEARLLVARARLDAEAERADAATQQRQQSTQELASMRARAIVEVERVRRRATRRHPELIARIVTRVRADLASLVPDTADPPPATLRGRTGP
jgi:hypothetical protein